MISYLRVKLYIHINALILQLDENVQKNLHRIPMQLQEMVVKMLCRDTAARPSVKTLLNTPYFW